MNELTTQGCEREFRAEERAEAQQEKRFDESVRYAPRGEGGAEISLLQLCKDVSGVINRVRAAFVSVPMWEAVDRPEIKEAERVVDLEAKRLQRGEGGPAAWRRALNEYEAAWMAILGEMRGA